MAGPQPRSRSTPGAPAGASGEDAQVLVAEGDLVDRHDQGGGAEVNPVRLALPDFADGMIRTDHGLLEARVDQILFARAVGHSLDLFGGELPTGHTLDRLEQAAIRSLFEAPLHPPEADVTQVLHPLEVGNGDAPRVDVGVGNEHDVAAGEDRVRLGSGRTVRRLDHDLRLYPRRVLRRDLPLQRRGNEDVALELERVFPPG